MAKTRKPEIKTRTDLARLVYKALGDKWKVDCDEADETRIDSEGVHHEHVFKLFVIIYSPKCLSTSLRAKTLAGLAKKVEEELMDQLQEEFNRMQVYWQRPPEADLLDERGRALTHSPLRLTHKTQ